MPDSLTRIGCVIIFLLLVLANGVLFGQNSFYAVNNGNWNNINTWADSPGGIPGSGLGNGYPEALDDAYTSGFTIVITAGATCKNLAVSYDNTSLNGPPGGGGLLTITGTMAGWDDLSLLPRAPIVDVFGPRSLTVRFTAANNDGINPFLTLVSGEVLGYWNRNSPFGTVLFQLQQDAVLDAGDVIFGGDSELEFSTISLSGGTLATPLQLQTGPNLTSIRGTTLTIAANTTLVSIEVPISGPGVIETDRLTSTSISGTLITTSYLNTRTISISATGTLETSYNGTFQTEGWWYDTNRPNPFPTTALNAASTVSFNYPGNQNLLARTYGNLNLEGSGTKSLNGSGLIIQGSLAVESNTTFSPTSEVDFTTASAAQISGDGTLNFNGGFEVAKSGSLVLNKSLSTLGIKVTSGTLNLGDFTTTLSGGDVTIGLSGITIAGTGTLVVAGNSNFAGTGSLALHNLTTQAPTGVADIEIAAWSITGDITNSGSIVLPATSTVTFNGGSAQNISGNAFDIGNMLVNKISSTLNNNVNLTLLGTLTMTTGTFDADGVGLGNFILNSDTNGDARIGPMSGGSIAGEVTFERYFDNTVIPQTSQWRNFAFPVTGVDYSELAGSLTLQSGSLATYTESVTGNVDQGWVFPTSGTLNSALGHTAWMYSSAPTTISVRGPLLRALPNVYNYGVTFTNNGDASADGWNFIPNPYASPINWNSASGWVKTNVGGVAVIWDQVGQTYQTASVIAQGQGFWVQAAAGPLLTSTEAVKTADLDPTFYREADAEKSKIFISLKSGRFKDVTTIQFRKDATEEHDLPFDAYKLKNGIYNLSSLTKGGANLMVNVLPESRCGSSIKLNITNIDPGTYSMNFDGLESFDNLKSITLIDNFGKKAQVIEPGEIYSFEVTSAPESYGSERFIVQFEFTDQTPNPVISKEGNRLTSSSLEGNQWYLNDTPIEGATGRSFVPSVHGEYYVRVQDGRCNLKSEVIPVIDGLNRIFPNPASEWLKVDVHHLAEDGLPGRILIHSTQGQLIRNESFTSQDGVKDIDILGIRPGSYIVTVVSGTGVILEKSKVVIK